MIQGEFQAASALARGFGIWLKNLPAFLLMTLLVYSPVVVYTAAVLNRPLTAGSLARMETVSALLTLALNLIVTAAVLFGVIQQLRGHRVGIGPCIAVGVRRLVPALGVGAVSVLPFVLVGAIAAVAPSALLLLVVPMVVYYLVIYVAIPAAVIERPGVIGALRRSAQLTSGHKLPIFGVLLILAVLSFVVAYLMAQALGGDVLTLADRKPFYWADLVFDVTFASLTASINAVIYHDLRAAREGVSAEDLARAFE